MRRMRRQSERAKNLPIHYGYTRHGAVDAGTKTAALTSENRKSIAITHSACLAKMENNMKPWLYILAILILGPVIIYGVAVLADKVDSTTGINTWRDDARNITCYTYMTASISCVKD